MTRRGTLGTVGAALVVMGASLVASLSGPVDLVSRPRSDEMPEFLPPPTTQGTRRPVSETPTPEGVGASAWDLSFVLTVLTQVFVALLVLAALLGLAMLIQALLRRRPHVEALETFAVPPVPEELLRSAESRMALLESGEPRNAIVAAWLDLEAAAAESGLPRHPSETSTEYTTKVIGRWAVDRQRLDDLAQLYREARFSRHPLGEAERRRAIDDLRVLHADLAEAAQQAAQVDHESERP